MGQFLKRRNGTLLFETVTPPNTPASARRDEDGVFHNPWPDSEPHGWRDLMRWFGERRGQSRVPTPPRGSFPTARPLILYPRNNLGELSATWIGHSTVLLQFNGLNILTDPVFSQRAFPVQWAGPRRIMDPGMAIGELPPIDVVLLSHNHYDHLDRPAVKRVMRNHPDITWIVPPGVGSYIRRWGARTIAELNWWDSTTVGALSVTATPTRHFSGRTFRDRNRSLWSGFALETGGKRVYFVGDTAYHPAFRDIGARLGPFDFAMIPIGAYDPRWFMGIVHVDPEEAVAIYQDVTSPFPNSPLPTMPGIHWGTFRLTDEAMDEPPRRTVARWRLSELPEDRLWIA